MKFQSRNLDEKINENKLLLSTIHTAATELLEHHFKTSKQRGVFQLKKGNVYLIWQHSLITLTVEKLGLRPLALMPVTSRLRF